MPIDMKDIHNSTTRHRFWFNLESMTDEERKNLHEKWHKTDVDCGMGHITYMSSEEVKECLEDEKARLKEFEKKEAYENQ